MIKHYDDAFMKVLAKADYDAMLESGYSGEGWYCWDEDYNPVHTLHGPYRTQMQAEDMEIHIYGKS